MKANAEWFKGAALLVNNNNTWLGDDRPCLTYGLRGVLKMIITVSLSCFMAHSDNNPLTAAAALQVTGAKRDLHSGVDGGASFEPLMDLSAVVSSLVEVCATTPPIPVLMCLQRNSLSIRQ